jgi:transcriptional regulator with XRE-family HTH domain
MITRRQALSGERLVAERLRRHWTQLEVADRLGTTPGNVSRWERGITSPGPYFRHKLCELFGKGTRELVLICNEQESVNQAWLAQTVAQFLQELILENGGTVVLVVLM